MATKTDIRNKALKRLGILGATQTATAEQAVDLEAAYDEVYAELEANDLAVWDDETIPNEFVAPVVALVAQARLDEYSVSTERYQRIVADASRAIPRIISAYQGEYSSEFKEVDF